MITIEAFLLTCLIEECAEIIQRATKALHFGLAEVQPGQPDNNQERLQDEYLDLAATVHHLRRRGVDLRPSLGAVSARMPKIAEKLKYAQECGEVEPGTLSLEAPSHDH